MPLQTIIGGQGGGVVAPSNPPPPVVAGQPPTLVGDIVTTRDPKATDDGTAGYVAGASFWYNASNGKVWSCTSSATGAAVWANVTPTQLPGDWAVSQGVPPAAAYGMRLLYAAYTGYCIDVVRDLDGATASFGFLANGAFDIPSLTTFLNGGAYALNVPASGSISRWYDQSGAGNHATQATAVYMPRILPSQLIGGVPSIISAFVDAPRTIEYLNIPTSVAFSAAAFSVFGVHRSLSAYTVGNFWQLNAATNMSLTSNVNQSSTNLSVDFASTAKTISTKQGLLTATIAGVVVAAGTNATRLVYDEQTTAGTSAVTGSVSGGYIFAGGTAGSPPTLHGNNECACLLLIPYTLTTAQQASLMASINGTFELAPQVRDTLYIDGDSIAWGNLSNLGRVPGRKMEPYLAKPFRIISGATSGDTLLGRATKYPLLAGASGIFNSAAKNSIFLSQAATNDLAMTAWAPSTAIAVGSYRYNNGQFYRCTTAGTTAAAVNGPLASSGSVTDGTVTWLALGGAGTLAQDVYSRLTTLVSLAHATGWKVAVAIPLGRGDQTTLAVAELDTYRNLCRANAASADFVIDIASDPIMGADTAYTNKNYFYTDDLHLVDAGYDRMSAIWAAGVNQMVH